MTAVLQYSIPPLCYEDAAMSQSPQSIDRDLLGDWWMYAGMVFAFLNYSGFKWRHRPNHADQPLGVIIFVGSVFQSIATIQFIGGTGTTRMIITPESDHVEGMQQLADLLDATSAFAEDTRRAWTPTIDEVIERFYRARARGSRTTLRQLAEETGIPYSTLTKRKMEYDRAGGWGSRKSLEN